MKSVPLSRFHEVIGILKDVSLFLKVRVQGFSFEHDKVSAIAEYNIKVKNVP